MEKLYRALKWLDNSIPMMSGPMFVVYLTTVIAIGIAIMELL